MDAKTILARISDEQVKFISLQFTDVSGTVKSVDIPISQLRTVLENGIWFDGSSVEGFTRIQESDMHLRPDLSTYAVLPWTPEAMRRARFICDIELPNGEPFDGDPRAALKKIVQKIEAKGWTYNIGPEPEFYLFNANGNHIHPVPFDTGSYFDFSADDSAVRIRSKLIQALTEIGLDVEVGHHECGLGQHEIDFRFADAVQAADNILMMKFTVKAIAAQEGIIASFMPKPVFGQAGSGMHCHQSIVTHEGRNLFYDPLKAFNLSEFARSFIAGQLKHARALISLVSPSVNSFKRLVPGYEAPVYIGWAQTNRSALIRIPQAFGREMAIRAELRCPDPSCNPYIALTGMLAAGLEGVEQNLTPPEPWENLNVYELSRKERKAQRIDELPGSLREALLELEQDTLLRDALGEKLYESYLRAKWTEWDAYKVSVSDWEVERYLKTI